MRIKTILKKNFVYLCLYPLILFCINKSLFAMENFADDEVRILNMTSHGKAGVEYLLESYERLRSHFLANKWSNKYSGYLHNNVAFLMLDEAAIENVEKIAVDIVTKYVTEKMFLISYIHHAQITEERKYWRSLHQLVLNLHNSLYHFGPDSINNKKSAAAILDPSKSFWNSQHQTAVPLIQAALEMLDIDFTNPEEVGRKAYKLSSLYIFCQLNQKTLNVILFEISKNINYIILKAANYSEDRIRTILKSNDDKFYSERFNTRTPL